MKVRTTTEKASRVGASKKKELIVAPANVFLLDLSNEC
jgi:hypothetical protein